MTSSTNALCWSSIQQAQGEHVVAPPTSPTPPTISPRKAYVVDGGTDIDVSIPTQQLRSHSVTEGLIISMVIPRGRSVSGIWLVVIFRMLDNALHRGTWYYSI